MQSIESHGVITFIFGICFDANFDYRVRPIWIWIFSGVGVVLCEEKIGTYVAISSNEVNYVNTNAQSTTT